MVAVVTEVGAAPHLEPGMPLSSRDGGKPLPGHLAVLQHWCLVLSPNLPPTRGSPSTWHPEPLLGYLVPT